MRERVVKNMKMAEGNKRMGISGGKKETSGLTGGGGTSGSTKGKSSTRSEKYGIPRHTTILEQPEVPHGWGSTTND
jgi:hypothetical protein